MSSVSGCHQQLLYMGIADILHMGVTDTVLTRGTVLHMIVCLADQL